MRELKRKKNFRILRLVFLFFMQVIEKPLRSDVLKRNSFVWLSRIKLILGLKVWTLCVFIFITVPLSLENTCIIPLVFVHPFLLFFLTLKKKEIIFWTVSYYEMIIILNSLWNTRYFIRFYLFA